MRLACANVAGQNQPAARRFRELTCLVEGGGQASITCCIERLEGARAQPLRPVRRSASRGSSAPSATTSTRHTPRSSSRARKRWSSCCSGSLVVMTVGKRLSVAVIQDLEQLFLRPRRAALRSEIVEDQQRRRLDGLEQIVVRDVAARCERGSQMVEQIGHDGEEDLDPELDLAIGNRRREMRLAARRRACQQHPARRLLGVRADISRAISPGSGAPARRAARDHAAGSSRTCGRRASPGGCAAAVDRAARPCGTSTGSRVRTRDRRPARRGARSRGRRTAGSSAQARAPARRRRRAAPAAAGECGLWRRRVAPFMTDTPRSPGTSSCAPGTAAAPARSDHCDAWPR